MSQCEEATRVSPVILLSLTSLFWSLNFIIGKLVVDVIPPITISFFRWGLPLLFYLLYAWKEIKANKQVYRDNWILILILGASGYSLNAIFVYEAVRFTSTINTSFINAFNPVLIALIGFAFCGYTVSVNQVVGFSLSLAGVTWIIFRGNLASAIELQVNTGDLMMVASITIWSIHTILYKRYANLFPAQTLFTMMMLGGVLVTIPLVLAENFATGISWLSQIGNRHIWGIIALNVFPSVLAYRFWNQTLDKVPANKVAVFLYLIPVFTVINSLLFLGESLQRFQVIGGILILAGVTLVTNTRQERS